MRVLFEYELRNVILLRFATWRICLESGWAAGFGIFGRGVPALMGQALRKRWRTSERALETSEEMWIALWRTIVLFQDVASRMATNPGFTYVVSLDEKMTAYLHTIPRLLRTKTRAGAEAPARLV